MNRFGLSIDLAAYCFDSVKASHHAATTNFIRGFLASLTDDIEAHELRVAQPAAIDKSQTEAPLEINRLLKLEPNIFGFGFNLNHVIDKLFKKKR